MAATRADGPNRISADARGTPSRGPPYAVPSLVAGRALEAVRRSAPSAPRRPSGPLSVVEFSTRRVTEDGLGSDVRIRLAGHDAVVRVAGCGESRERWMKLPPHQRRQPRWRTSRNARRGVGELSRVECSCDAIGAGSGRRLSGVGHGPSDVVFGRRCLPRGVDSLARVTADGNAHPCPDVVRAEILAARYSFRRLAVR